LFNTLSLEDIDVYVYDFCEYAKYKQDCFFFVTRIGCGLAGLKDEQIAPMFKQIAHLDNVSFAEEWEKYL
jgi:hypothetical protein